nr:RNA-directed DNA polymerase, eukaryota, reverse transcriptase zinc-binding domain protein [Tanacetum cinerariifolium]
MRSKVNDWKNRALSYARRVRLIASILSSIQNYWASVFLLPKQVIYEINKMLKGFLWCQGELAKGKAKVSWEAVCKPKNQAQHDSQSSVGWKNIMSLRDKVRKHIRWKLGNGKSINAWHDRWCSVSPLSDFITTRDMYDARLRNECIVKEVIHEGRWKWPAEWSNDFMEFDQLQVPMLREDMEDKAVWKSENGSEKKL